MSYNIEFFTQYLSQKVDFKRLPNCPFNTKKNPCINLLVLIVKKEDENIGKEIRLTHFEKKIHYDHNDITPQEQKGVQTKHSQYSKMTYW